jgi:hypothetical protein
MSGFSNRTEGSYYTDFSKYILQSSSRPKSPVCSYKYKDWAVSPNSINNLSLKELKSALKNERERHSGSKSALKSRLLSVYNRIKSAIKIQSAFRRYLVIESERLKGPGYKCRNMCVNDTDFFTMDKMQQIPLESFFSYVANSGIVYGFNIFSLLMLFKTTQKFENPYTREDIPTQTICDIFSLCKKNEILCPLAFSKNRICDADKIIANIPKCC